MFANYCYKLNIYMVLSVYICVYIYIYICMYVCVVEEDFQIYKQQICPAIALSHLKYSDFDSHN